MTDDKNPIEQAVDQAMDAFVYAPIGLVFDGPALFPTLVDKGRTQVQVARMMGKMAVQMGQSEAEKRVAAADGPLRDVLVAVGLAPPSPPPGSQPEPTVTSTTSTKASTASVEAPTKKPAAKKPAAKKPAAKKSAAKKSTAKNNATTKLAAKKSAARQPTASTAAARKAGAPAVFSLSIPDYDSLSASQVVKRLRGMPDAELEAIRAYEAATRARKTVLNRVTQIQKG